MGKRIKIEVSALKFLAVLTLTTALLQWGFSQKIGTKMGFNPIAKHRECFLPQEGKEGQGRYWG